jgi:hypothetical protein
MYCSGVKVVVRCRWMVDMRALFLGGVTKSLTSQFVLHGDAFAHLGSSVPACSAAIYLAYHSDQFGSASLMRFPCSRWAAAARRSALSRSVPEPNEVIPGSMRPGSRSVIPAPASGCRPGR